MISAVGMAIRGGRLCGCARRVPIVLGLPLPNSIALDDAVFSMFLPANPKEALFAEGDEGDDGDPDVRLRRLAGGRAEGTPGDSQKNEPRPGDPLKDETPPNAGDCCVDGSPELVWSESTSISISSVAAVADRGEITIGSV
jgi:hypothetical protein